MNPKTVLRVMLLVLLSWGAVGAANAQLASSAASSASGVEPPKAALASTAPDAKTGSSPAGVASTQQVEELQRSVTTLTASVDKIANKGTDFTVPLFGLLGVLVGGAIQVAWAWWASRSKEQADLLLLQKKWTFEVAQSIVEWKLKQLSELYGPLRTLFTQSNAVYRTMNVVLQNAAPDKFRLLGPEDMKLPEFQRFAADASDDGYLFVINRDAKAGWEIFRTILQIDEVYGKGYGVEVYFDKIVEISARIVSVIEAKAGMAISEEQNAGGVVAGATKSGVQGALGQKFGQYLAHAAVLASIHANRRAAFRASLGEKVDGAPLALNLATHRSAAFPQDIQKLIGTDYKSLQDYVSNWERSATSKQ